MQHRGDGDQHVGPVIRDQPQCGLRLEPSSRHDVRYSKPVGLVACFDQPLKSSAAVGTVFGRPQIRAVGLCFGRGYVVIDAKEIVGIVAPLRLP